MERELFGRDLLGRRARGARSERRPAVERAARRMNRIARERMTDPGFDWFVVFVRSGQEFQTQRALRHWDAGVYLPMCRKWRGVNRYRKDKIKIAYPAIAGFLFVGFERGRAPWFDLMTSIASLYRVLSLDGAPVAFDGSVVAEFINDNRARLDVADEEQFMRTHHEFQVGDQVRVVDGPLEDWVVEVQEIRGAYAKIVLDLLGRTQDVEIPLDILENAA